MSHGTEAIRHHDFFDMVLENPFGGNSRVTDLTTAQGFSHPNDNEILLDILEQCATSDSFVIDAGGSSLELATSTGVRLIPLFVGSMTSLREKTKKSVRFQNVTMYSFGRLQGFSGVPSQDGPTLGMGYEHTCVETYDIVDSLELSNACALTEQSNGCLMESEDACEEVTARLRQRNHIGCVQPKEHRVVGNAMQPLSQRERRRLLLAAGVTIDKTEAKESKTVRNSRMFCGCLCQVICIPDSCSCSLSEIPCQVDRDSFPCGCSLSGCANPVGRNQFDRSKVHLHRLMRLSQVDKALDRKVAMMEALDLWLVASPSKYPKLAFGKQGFNRNYPKKRMSKKKMLVNEPVDSVVAKSSVRLEKNCNEVIDTMNSAFSFEDDVVKFTDGAAEGSDFSIKTDDNGDIVCESRSMFRLQTLSSGSAQINKDPVTETLTFSSLPDGDSKEIPGRSVDLENESDRSGCQSVAKDSTRNRNAVVSEEDVSLSLVDGQSIAYVSSGLVEGDVAFRGFILPTDFLDLRKNGMSSSTLNVSLVMKAETQDSKAESYIGTDKTFHVDN